MVKDKIIKSQIKDIIKQYDNDNVKFMEGVKNVILNNCSYNELFKFYKFIKFNNCSTIFYFHEGKLVYDFSPITIDIKTKYDKVLFDKQHKKIITQKILDELKNNNLNVNNMWTLIQFNDKSVLLQLEDPKSSVINNLNIKDDRADQFAVITVLDSTNYWNAELF